ncbi:PIN domain-containing protein [Frankia gtarii]|uniref:PIN domain-containing protein n=1 Tax=Frankia gtarii TaxID=2950102 RepID=UPI0021BDFB38|nr:PIN domain-containing protein [Frankia gtarii]
MSFLLDTHVISELRKPARRRHDLRQAAVLDSRLDHSVLPAYAGWVLDVDPAVADSAARLHVPDRRPAHDALIAATAQVHSLALVTRNESDFAPLGVPLMNPWKHRVRRVPG